ncbi:MAG: lipid A deacylase LpxR family protein, partial [Pseudobdellovibrio sp.]
MFNLLLIWFLGYTGFSASGKAITAYVENDSSKLGGPGSDSAYTSGIKLSYVYIENQEPVWASPFLKIFPAVEKEVKKSQSNFSFSLGQQIYTPNNTGTSQTVTNDRPYAGWLYAGVSANVKEEMSSHILELDVGVIGPEAEGESIQNGFHRVIGEQPAEGWSHQLGNQAAFQLSYQERTKIYELKNEIYQNYFDAIPLYGAVLGNVAVNAYAGALVRLGTHLPDSFGPTRSSSPEGDTFVDLSPKTLSETSLYVFGGARGTAVLHNLFLDGENIHKKTLVGETEFGFGTQFYFWAVS